MTNVSELTREMISDYEAMVGRKLTPQEYLQFRSQAMIELQNGFMVATPCVSNIIESTPVVPAVVEPIPVAQPVVATPIVSAPVVPIVAEQIPMAAPTPVVQIPVKKEPIHEVVTVEIESPASMEEEEPSSSFFALIDRIEA